MIGGSDGRAALFEAELERFISAKCPQSRHSASIREAWSPPLALFFVLRNLVASSETNFGHFGLIFGSEDAKSGAVGRDTKSRSRWIVVGVFILFFIVHIVLEQTKLIAIIMEDVDNNELLQQMLNANKASVSRSKGQKTSKFDEDVKLASWYVFVTTNAATGPNQNGATFWEKIRANFVRCGGSAGRTTVSLQKRFNKTVQAQVNKYIGILQFSMRKHHSGWVMDDYVCNAKKKFRLKFGKHFKHEAVFTILKKSLPKYEINVSTLDARVARALFFVDNYINQDWRQEGALQRVIGAATW